MSWTDERVERLKQLWSDGLSASQIAAQLGGVTRNAVIGKVHRLGLSGRAKSSSSSPRPRKPRAPSHPMRTSRSGPRTIGNTALKAAPAVKPRPAPEPVPIESIVVPISKRATILTLTEHTCKWPIGDPGDQDFHFCGNTSKAGLPYCEYHCRVAYQPIGERRRDKQAARG